MWGPTLITYIMLHALDNVKLHKQSVSNVTYKFTQQNIWFSFNNKQYVSVCVRVCYPMKCTHIFLLLSALLYCLFSAHKTLPSAFNFVFHLELYQETLLGRNRTFLSPSLSSIIRDAHKFAVINWIMASILSVERELYLVQIVSQWLRMNHKEQPQQRRRRWTRNRGFIYWNAHDVGWQPQPAVHARDNSRSDWFLRIYCVYSIFICLWLDRIRLFRSRCAHTQQWKPSKTSEIFKM